MVLYILKGNFIYAAVSRNKDNSLSTALFFKLAGRNYHYRTSLNILLCQQCDPLPPLHRELSFSIRISLVNVNKSAENCGFVCIY